MHIEAATRDDWKGLAKLMAIADGVVLLIGGALWLAW